MKLPSAEHPIEISALNQRLVVTWKGVVVAQSDNVLSLKEAAYPVVLYVPRSDIIAAHFQRTERSSYCPYKGNASYYSLIVPGHADDNAAWSYEEPYPAMAEIKEYVAFYPDRVSFELTPL